MSQEHQTTRREDAYMDKMNYNSVLDYLYNCLPMYHRIGAQAYKADLGNTVALCEILGNPQNSFPTIHIGGTNGKGSVSHMLASILQAAGYRTGLYTSPHLVDFRERIRVDGKMIRRDYITQFITQYREKTELIRPSFFEWTVGIAFDYFRSMQVDIAVIEVGLGGRLDSTNIIHPRLSVITNISMDHMQFLGDTLEKIAGEKAGIIKEGIPVVIGETQPETEPVFVNVAGERNAPITFADREFSIIKETLAGRYLHKRRVKVRNQQSGIEHSLLIPLAGKYQLKNLLTVLESCNRLNELGFHLPPNVIRKGITNVVKTTKLRGRWQILRTQPLTICDVGHNEGGLTEVLEQIETMPHEALHCVIGFVNDKDLVPILSLLPRKAEYYFCRPDIPRGLDAEILREEALKAGLTGRAYRSVPEALRAAFVLAGRNDLVFAGGSTFVVAEVVAVLKS